MMLSAMKYVYYIYTHVQYIAIGVFGFDVCLLHQCTCSGQIQLYITSYTAEWWYAVISFIYTQML